MKRRKLLTGAAIAPAFLAESGQAATAPAAASGYQAILDMLASADDIARRNSLEDPARLAAFRKQVLMSFCGAFIEGASATVDKPDWVPYLPYYLPRSGPNPDTIYRYCPLDANGQYRIYGTKGNESIATITLRKGGAHLGQLSGARVGEIDLKTLRSDSRGRYSLLLSRERPAGYRGNWFAMPAEATCMMSRHVTKSVKQADGVCGVERLDKPTGPTLPDPAEYAREMERMAQYALRQNEFLPRYLDGLRKRNADKDFILDEQVDYGGLINQAYHFYLFKIEPGEALIFESDTPKSSVYWSVQLTDPYTRTIDYVARQSSLNDAQAVLDPDRKVRCVLALEDPGVANWLDPGGWREGAVLWRWNDASHVPQPRARRVKLAQLRDALPPATPAFGPAQRQAMMRERIALYQSRRR